MTGWGAGVESPVKKAQRSRIVREAMVFTVSAQTGPIMEATLRRLAGIP